MRHGAGRLPLGLQSLGLVDGARGVGCGRQLLCARDQGLLVRDIARVPRGDACAQAIQRAEELPVERAARVAIHRSVAAPVLRRLAQHAHDQRVIGLLRIERRLEGEQALEHLLARVEIRAADRRLFGEVHLAGLEGSGERLLESFGFRRGFDREALVDRAPFLTQRADVFGERLGRFVHADQRFHFLDQLDALRCGDVVFPLPQFVQARVELFEAASERGRERRCVRQRGLDRLTESRGLARIATGERRATEADQADDLCTRLGCSDALFAECLPGAAVVGVIASRFYVRHIFGC